MKMTGYKGFDSKLQCRGFQYEVGKTFETEDAVLCQKGFHFCENPLHVLNYYPPVDKGGNRSLYAVIEADGVLPDTHDDSKRASTTLTVKDKIGLPQLIKTGVEYTVMRSKKCPATSGDHSTAATSGDCSTAATSGDSSTAKVTGENSIAITTGTDGKATGALGCWIVLTEWHVVDGESRIKDVKPARVDGETIKAGVLYCLKDGVFVEAEIVE